jgi:transposase
METKVEQVLANALCDINPRYKQREASGRISHPAVCFVKEGSYAELEQVMYEAKKKNGVSYGQIKVPTMLKAEGHDQWIKFLQSRRVQV